jgi:hypothetical protein
VDEKYYLSQKSVERLLNYKDSSYGNPEETNCNTITARTGHSDTVGTYLAQTDRQTEILKVNGYHSR